MPRHFSFAGMQRAGNHAVIEWWMHHFEGWNFRNNILGHSCKCRAAQEQKHGDYHVRVRIDSWESVNPYQIQVSNNSEPLITVIRDPFNWWASWFRYPTVNPHTPFTHREETIDWYLTYILYARHNPTINYNRWFLHPHYRRTLEKEWDLGKSDASLNHVSTFGQGSSFDGIAYEGMAQQMPVLTRYEQVLHLPEYVEPLRKHPELADISREIFNMQPPKGIYDYST